ncbi:MAG: ABC transporter ATP-binding protein [Magnetococcales bacterium]|nr:ABC transporter ATP-binding protein [Magnetococcales bacterium]
MNDRSLLCARGVVKTFTGPGGPVQVLKGVDLDLQVGAMAALLGVSGSGKSTLIQILGSLDHPSAGQVLLQGQDLFALSQNKRAEIRNRRIGFVYQFHRLLPEFSAMENVMMPLLVGRMPWDAARRRATATLEEVGLAHRLGHKPGQMSGGEQQRAAIARAVVTGPDLMLADEPTGNLDLETAEGLFQLLLTLNRDRKLTLLMVTHNPALAERCHRRLRMVDGHLLEPGAEEWP